MFRIFKPREKLDLEMIGDLDIFRRKVFYITFQQKNWRAPDLTVREYAQFCQLVSDVEKAGQTQRIEDIRATERAYDALVRLCIPSMPWWVRRKLTMVESTALFVAIMKRHGVETEKKRTE